MIGNVMLPLRHIVSWCQKLAINDDAFWHFAQNPISENIFIPNQVLVQGCHKKHKTSQLVGCCFTYDLSMQPLVWHSL